MQTILSEKEIDIDTFKLIRYGSKNPQPDKQPIMNLKAIAMFFGLPYSNVIKLHRQSQSLSNNQIQTNRRFKHKFNINHLNYLIGRDTLFNQAGLSVRERCIMFHRAFPDKRISVTHLRRLYKRAGIRFKSLRLRKEIELVDPIRLVALKTEMKTKYLQELQLGSKIIFIDETVFTNSTRLNKTWSLKGENIRFPDKRHDFGAYALLAGISTDVGLEDYIINKGSIKSEQFILFMQKLRDKYKDQRLVVFMDNLQVHKSANAKKEYERLSINPIFSIPYSPEYNGIESTFFTIKQYYKKQMLKILNRGQQLNIIRLIEQSIQQVDQDYIKNQAKYGETQIMSIKL